VAGPGRVGKRREGQEGQPHALQRLRTGPRGWPLKGGARFGSKRVQAHEGRRRTPANRNIPSASPCVGACARESVHKDGVGGGKHFGARKQARGASRDAATGRVPCSGATLKINEFYPVTCGSVGESRRVRPEPGPPWR